MTVTRSPSVLTVLTKWFGIAGLTLARDGDARPDAGLLKIDHHGRTHAEDDQIALPRFLVPFHDPHPSDGLAAKELTLFLRTQENTPN
jgi:hypothetical protein